MPEVFLHEFMAFGDSGYYEKRPGYGMSSSTRYCGCNTDQPTCTRPPAPALRPSPLPPLQLIHFGSNVVSRIFEFQADNFAVTQVGLAVLGGLNPELRSDCSCAPAGSSYSDVSFATWIPLPCKVLDGANCAPLR